MNRARGAAAAAAAKGAPAARGVAAPLTSPRLRALATRSAGSRGAARHAGGHAEGRILVDGRAAAGAAETCDLCAEALGARHAHLVDLRERSLVCVCRPCSLLFAEPGAGGDRYRLVPDRVRSLANFRLGELDWAALRIPVDLAFFFHSTPAGRVVAFYPGPMGATESRLSLEHWERLVAANPALAKMEPDVEALLVHRLDSRRDGWLVPVDACYELVGLLRTRWTGLTGGAEVWDEVRAFFERLRHRAGRMPRSPGAPRSATARGRPPGVSPEPMRQGEQHA